MAFILKALHMSDPWMRRRKHLGL